MPELNVSIIPLSDDMVQIDVGGFLDAHTFDNLEQIFAQQFEKNVFKLIVRLDQLEYISSAGIGVFVGTVERAQENGGNIVLLNPSESVMEVLELLGLSEIFPKATSTEEAKAQFG